MKHLILSILLLLLSQSSFSQLMRSEVYDFTIGDYFGLENKASVSGSGIMTVRYQMIHILTKQLSATTDSVTYSAQRQTYFPSLPNGSGGGTTPSYSIDTFTFMHTNLNTAFSPEIWDNVFGNSVTHFWDSDTNECYNALDTLIPSPWCFNNSGQASHFGMHINNPDSCELEASSSDYYAYSHAGGPYGGKGPSGDPTELTLLVELFYVVHNGVECGQFPTFFLGISEETQLVLNVSPNPAQDKITVLGITAIGTCTVLSSDGKNVSQKIAWKENEVDVSSLDSGTYFLKVTDESGKTGTVRFVKK
jgi:hypothetical protein